MGGKVAQPVLLSLSLGHSLHFDSPPVSFQTALGCLTKAAVIPPVWDRLLDAAMSLSVSATTVGWIRSTRCTTFLCDRCTEGPPALAQKEGQAMLPTVGLFSVPRDRVAEWAWNRRRGWMSCIRESQCLGVRPRIGSKTRISTVSGVFSAGGLTH